MPTHGNRDRFIRHGLEQSSYALALISKDDHSLPRKCGISQGLSVHIGSIDPPPSLLELVNSLSKIPCLHYGNPGRCASRSALYCFSQRGCTPGGDYDGVSTECIGRTENGTQILWILDMIKYKHQAFRDLRLAEVVETARWYDIARHLEHHPLLVGGHVCKRFGLYLMDADTESASLFHNPSCPWPQSPGAGCDMESTLAGMRPHRFFYCMKCAQSIHGRHSIMFRGLP